MLQYTGTLLVWYVNSSCQPHIGSDTCEQQMAVDVYSPHSVDLMLSWTYAAPLASVTHMCLNTEAWPMGTGSMCMANTL